MLPGVARGTVRICLGYTEPDTGSDLANVKTRSTRDSDEWVLTGQKMFTTDAQHCQYSFLVARTNPDAARHWGLTMFLVPLEVAGVEITAIHTLGGERTNFVFYDNVRIGDHYRLGPVDHGWMVLNGRSRPNTGGRPRASHSRPAAWGSPAPCAGCWIRRWHWAAAPGRGVRCSSRPGC